MRDIAKINSSQIYGLWMNVSMSLLAVILTIIISKILPYYLSPVIALVIATGLYVYIYQIKFKSSKSCFIPTISILYSVVVYAFVTIILNLMHIWGLFEMPKEFVFFTDPFIPSLIFSPVCLIVISVIYSQRPHLKTCIECNSKITFGGKRGVGGILASEAHLQIKNFLLWSFVITVVLWLYYQFSYVNININGRDTYIFVWLTVIAAFLDWLYFSWRYYNLYLDLKENDEIITPADLRDMTSKIYLRFYVICGNYLYLTEHGIEAFDLNRKKEVIDTPFFTKQSVNGLLESDVKKIIREMTGVNDGELRFFYGRKSPSDNKHRLIRYFYFLDGDINDYPELAMPGEWVSFEKVKYIYSDTPEKMAELAVYDITRLATIMLTEKIFDENGLRKSGIKSYNPTFNLLEVKKSKIDFQDDKWIEISLFNSDTPLYKFKKWWKERLQGSRKKIG